MNEDDIIKLNDLVPKLHDLGNTLYSKWGTESYVERCNLSDIRDEIVRVVERAKIPQNIDDLRSELIAFCCECNIELPRDKDYIDLVDGYLKTRL